MTTTFPSYFCEVPRQTAIKSTRARLEALAGVRRESAEHGGHRLTEKATSSRSIEGAEKLERVVSLSAAMSMLDAAGVGACCVLGLALCVA